jgi:hypothetical protein
MPEELDVIDVDMDIDQRNWLILHLHLQGESARKIGKTLKIAHTTVMRYISTPDAQKQITSFRDTLANFLTAQVEAANIVALRNATSIASDPDMDELVRLKASELILNYTAKMTSVGRAVTLENNNKLNLQKPSGGTRGGDGALSLLDEFDKT